MTNLLLHFSKSEIDDLLVLERGEGRYVFDTDGRRTSIANAALTIGACADRAKGPLLAHCDSRRRIKQHELRCPGSRQPSRTRRTTARS